MIDIKLKKLTDIHNYICRKNYKIDTLEYHDSTVLRISKNQLLYELTFDPYGQFVEAASFIKDWDISLSVRERFKSYNTISSVFIDLEGRSGASFLKIKTKI